MNENLIFSQIIYDGVIDSYSVKQYDSGIIRLMITTTDKWVGYHRYSNDEYGIGEYDENHGWLYTLKIPNLVIPEYHVCADNQEKDQITFYWIPAELITSGKMRENIINKRNSGE